MKRLVVLLSLGLLAACGQSGDLTRPGEGLKGTQYLIGSDDRQPSTAAPPVEQPAPEATDTGSTEPATTGNAHGHH